jgi:hypothetical protein
VSATGIGAVSATGTIQGSVSATGIGAESATDTI